MPLPDPRDPDVSRWLVQLSREGTARYNATRPRCASTNARGLPCGGVPSPGQLVCRFHGGHLDRPRTKKIGPHAPLGPKNPTRAHADRMRAVWKVDPWARGHTVALDQAGQEACERWLDSAGLNWNLLPPSVQDAARWRFYVLCRNGREPLTEPGCEGDIEKLRHKSERASDEGTGPHEDLSAPSELFCWRKVAARAPGRWQVAPTHPRKVLAAAEKQRRQDATLLAREPQSREEARLRLLALDRQRVREATARDDRTNGCVSLQLARDRGGW